jgi:hypothetical protein
MADKAANKEDKDFLYLCSNSSSLMDLNRDFRFGFPTQRFKGVLSEGSSYNCSFWQEPGLLLLDPSGRELLKRNIADRSAAASQPPVLTL